MNMLGGRVAKLDGSMRDFVLLERETELERCHEAFELARDGRGRIVALSGEAGAGKTSLVERFAASHTDSIRLYWGTCENLSTPEVLLPLRDMARAHTGFPEIGMSSAGGGTFPGGSGTHAGTFEAMLNLLTRGTGLGLLVVEDIHWADTATLDLIRFLARRIASAKVLIVVTYRDDELSARSPVRIMLGEAPSGIMTRLTLAPLSLAAVTRLAAGRGRQGEELFALTAGNPFLVTEVLASSEGELPPEAVRDATMARAARLSERARALLEAVSIFPRRAESAVVADLVRRRLDASVDECVEKGMLSLDGSLLQFRHELARRAIETSIAPSRRRDMHQKVVGLLQKRRDSRASELAHHAQRAGDVSAILEFARRAAGEASRAGASREAAAHLAAVLERRSSLPPAELVEVLEQYAEHRYLLGEAHLALISMTEASALRREEKDALNVGRDLSRLARYAWMCGRRNEAEAFAAESIAVLERVPPGAELAWAYSHQSQLDMLAARMDPAISWGLRALELATHLGEEEIVIHALGNVGSAKAERDAVQSCADLEQSLAMAVAGKYHDHAERAFCNLTCTHFWRRDYDAALRYIERGVAYARTLQLDHWEGYLRGWRSLILLDRGDWTAAEDEALEITNRHYAAEVYKFPALTALARVRLRRGDPDYDAPFEQARRLSATTGELQRTTYIATIAGEHSWLADMTKTPSAARPEATALLRDVVALAAQRDARWAAEDASLWLYELGEPQQASAVARMQTPFCEHAAGRWRAAAEGWHAIGRPYEEGLALSHGDESSCCRALEIFDRLGALPAAMALRRRLRAGGMRSVPRGPITVTRENAAGLTRRQMQVLSLIAEGLGNADIATRLCISAKTAEHHVAAIMARLDSPTRREAAEEARRRGLLLDAPAIATGGQR